MDNWTSRAADAAAVIRQRAELTPSVGIILGSGLGAAAADVAVKIRLSTSDLPHFPRPTVAGHAGEFVLGRVAGRAVAVLSGRAHGYEGHEPALLGLPVRALHALGCRTLIVTNAAGALNPAFQPGEVMLIEDHLSFPSLAGRSPLGGAPEPHLPRFVDLTDSYTPALRSLAEAAARRSERTLRRGVYVMVGGPNFETPAEVRFLRSIGADAVGMSTVPEVIVARQLGMSVLGFSAISNLAAGIPGARLAHDDVLATVARAAPVMADIIRGVLAELPK